MYLSFNSQNLIKHQNTHLEVNSQYYKVDDGFYKNTAYKLWKTWDTLKTILNKAKIKSDFPKFLLINGKQETDIRHMASHFNSYFINVGSEALDSTATLNKPPFASYLGPRCHLAFSFSYTNSEKILKIIEKLKPKTSSGPDGQSSKLLKAVGNILAPTLSVIINQSLYTGIFPDKLKVAKVLPLLKKGDTWLMENFDPFLYYQHCQKYLKGLYLNKYMNT